LSRMLRGLGGQEMSRRLVLVVGALGLFALVGVEAALGATRTFTFSSTALPTST
jgi:hypothetical protein